MKNWIAPVLVLATLLAAIIARPSFAATAYPLQLDDDGRHIVDHRGNEVFFHADSPWHVIARLTREETISFLDSREARGFNALLVALIVSEGYSTGSPDNAYGDAPFLVPEDFATPNEAYFSHADWFLQQAHARGITVFLTPAYIGYECNNSGWCVPMMQNGVTKMRDYGRWVGNRYKNQPNIVWVHGGDADAGAYGAMDVVDAVAYGILDVDANHLHTAHCRRYSSAADCYDRPWLDFNSTYADCTVTPADIHTDYVRSPWRPFVFIEGRYELERDWTDQCIRAQAYWSLLGGAVGQFYGNGPIWDFTSGWQGQLSSPGTTSMARFFNLLRSRRWDLLVPDYSHSVLTAGYGDINTSSYAAAARTADGNTVLVYTPSRRALTIAMNLVSGSAVETWWYNPVNGSYVSAGRFPASGSRDFTPPTDQDWVLVLDDQDANLGPPGQSDIFVRTQSHSWSSFKRGFRNQ